MWEDVETERREEDRWSQTDGARRSSSALSSLREEKLRNESACPGTENTPPSVIPPSFPLSQHRAEGRTERKEDWSSSQEAVRAKRQDSWRSPE